MQAQSHAGSKQRQGKSRTTVYMVLLRHDINPIIRGFHGFQAELQQRPS
jgi:hypothetical protein